MSNIIVNLYADELYPVYREVAQVNHADFAVSIPEELWAEYVTSKERFLTALKQLMQLNRLVENE